MRVVLRDDVVGVGRRGDIVKVAGGFARNFLLPEGRAIVATEGVEGQAEQMRRGRDQREAQDRGAAEAQATVLAGAVIPIAARASGAGRLFGSIGPADVVEAIKATKGIEVDRKHIVLPEHIKETGSFEVTVELFRDVATIVTVEVSPAS
jgi:large subunit ribosomal protein L9